ncbi:class I SAM-dependent methyltransferase [Pseudonocardia sp. NPDC046786]|uniref:class I SAM-dependent methyltransferase n=1 Tax=Pseudonocardia sp. NPDC046786 TaxID=3155471 RepID=UPI0034113458
MADPVPERMELEFDTVAGWTGHAVAELGDDHAEPAACRGSASPAGLDWLAARCGLRPGDLLADVGGGTGGPAAYARRTTGAAPVVIDPMPAACRAAATMFGLPAVVGGGDALPLATASARACWNLGVLCTVRDKAAVLAEAHRVLRPGGSLGLLVFVADRPRPPGAPDGNLFPARTAVHELLAAAGFARTAEVALTELPPAPAAWRQRIDRVENVLDRDHGDDPRFAAAQEQSRRIGALITDGVVEGRLLHATAR